MPEVAATLGTQHFGAAHAVAGVGPRFDAFVVGVVETRPATPGVELGFGVEQFGPAAGTGVATVVFVVDVLAAERGLRAGFAKDAILLVAELFAPLRVVRWTVVGVARCSILPVWP